MVDRRRPDSRGSVGRPPRQRLTKPDTTVGNWRRRRRSHNTAHGRASSHQFSDLEGERPADRAPADGPPPPRRAAPRRASFPLDREACCVPPSIVVRPAGELRDPESTRASTYKWKIRSRRRATDANACHPRTVIPASPTRNILQSIGRP